MWKNIELNCQRSFSPLWPLRVSACSGPSRPTVALDEVPLLPQEAHRKDRIGCPETQTSDGVIRHPISPRVMCSLGKAPTTLQLVHDTGSRPSEDVAEANHNVPAFLLLSALWFNLVTAALEISIQEKVKKQGEGSKEKMGGSVVYTGRYALRSHQKLLMRHLPVYAAVPCVVGEGNIPRPGTRKSLLVPLTGEAVQQRPLSKADQLKHPIKLMHKVPVPFTALLKVRVLASPEVSTALNLVSKASRNELLTGPRPWDALLLGAVIH